MKEKTGDKLQNRTHIYEIDFIRAVTVFSVVAIHSLSYTGFLTTVAKNVILLNLITHLLHFNREMFMFVTGLVLTYVYYSKPFSAKKFWLKRFSLILIPYIIWSIIYVSIYHHNLAFIPYMKILLWDILTGNSAFQLYYILIALQFYAIFPLFLMFLKKVIRYPFLTLGISLAVQLIIIYLDFHYLQLKAATTSKQVHHFVEFQERIFLAYAFFFILGGFVAINLEKGKKFMEKYGYYLPIAMIIAVWLFAVYYYNQLNIFHYRLQNAVSVLQPSVVIYSIVAIIFFSWLAFLWAKKRKAEKLVKTIANVSFGIYFIHVMILDLLTNYVVRRVAHFVPVPIIDISTIILAFSISTVLSYLIFKIPFFSWIIGKPTSKTKAYV